VRKIDSDSQGGTGSLRQACRWPAIDLNPQAENEPFLALNEYFKRVVVQERKPANAVECVL
jgi:hypothetical protein